MSRDTGTVVAIDHVGDDAIARKKNIQVIDGDVHGNDGIEIDRVRQHVGHAPRPSRYLGSRLRRYRLPVSLFVGV